jgi:hypothetical protein
MRTLRHGEEIAQLVRNEFRTLDPRELLRKEPGALLGVGAAAAAVLAALEIKTIFDLATSRVFEDAAKLSAAGVDSKSPLAQLGTAPADMVRETHSAGKKIDEVRFLPIDVLQAIPALQVPAVKKALDVEIVRDLALYPPYRAARRIVDCLFFPENAADFDPEAPSDLVPKSGEYPTERVQYTTLLMDEIKLRGNTAIVDLEGEVFHPIALDKLAQLKAGFQHVAYGALLTFNQSWYATAVTLGHLLHSTALAPGESTRMAVIDWSRKSRSGQTEVISEVDDLTNDMSQNRSISEVTQAVANEAQGGFSSTNTASKSSQSGEAAAGDFSAPLGGLFGGPSGSVASSSSRASSSSHADSYSSSWGHRDIGSTMMQNINDRTHQHAHSSRSRRAAVVKEVSQSEHEEVSTRVLTNYNHMHALTVQYYEVVQIYRVEVTLTRADRVVFIPLELTDFSKEDTIRTFRAVLARAALMPDIRDALRNLDVIEVEPDRTTRFSAFGKSIGNYLRDTIARRRWSPALVGDAAADAETRAADTKPVRSKAQGRALKIQVSDIRPAIEVANEHLWAGAQISRLANLLDRVVLRPDSSAMFLPTDVFVEKAVVSGNGNLKVVFYKRTGARVEGTPPAAIALADLSRIAVRGSDAKNEVSASITLTLSRNGVRFPLELPAVQIAPGTQGETRVVQLKPGGVNTNLKHHLASNRLHYSQAIFRSLDSAQIATLLAGFGVRLGDRLVPVSQVVDPRPIRFIGNYLAFRMNSDVRFDREWRTWLEGRGVVVGSTTQDIVPLGTGGTFAEAVLGRFNCAEKLDITRFWNWQDSPIPIQPTEIAAIQTGSRQSTEDVQPGQLSNPIINITQPASLPDPVGTAAALAAIQNGNMFRDMSGLQATVGLAQAALQATAAGAANAAQQAGTNQQNQLQATTERQRIAADMIKDLARTAVSAYTGTPVGGGSSLPPSNHSQDGAKVNYFDKMKEPATSGGTPSSNGAGPVTPAQGGASTPGGSIAGNGSNGSMVPVGSGYSQNPGILAATWGDIQPPSHILDRVLDMADSATSSPQPTKRWWPHLDEKTVFDRIDELKKSPNAITQGALGLCGEATFIRHITQRDPNLFESFATSLWGGGQGFIGNLQIDPDSDLRNADYPAIVAKRGSNTPPIPPQADWMILSALRDSQNEILDYEGTPEENFADGSDFSERVKWYEKSGLYTSVKGDSDTSLAHLKTITKTTKNHVSLRIDVALIQPGSSGKHVIALESALNIDEPNDKVTFDYWTWGESSVKTCTTTVTALKANYLGAIIAEFA